MTGLISAMQNIDAFAFAVLGVVTIAAWLRARDPNAVYLALAIVMLAVVSTLGEIPILFHAQPQWLPPVSLVLFVGSGYALLRYRAAVIPLRTAWHAAAVAALVATSLASLLAPALGAPSAVVQWAGIALIVAWAVVVLEPILRFWIVARRLPAVQAWRLRSLSIGFSAIVAILVLLVVLAGAGTSASSISEGAQLAVQVVVLLVIPLLYVSFSPPAWLRREWRAAEEEGLRGYMEGLLVSDDAATLNEGALSWAARISGAGSAVSFDSRGRLLGAAGLDEAAVAEVERLMPALSPGIDHHALARGITAIAVVPIVSPVGTGRLALVAGPFTPAFGPDELSRVQQFMTAVTAGLDRKRLVSELKSANAQLKDASEHKSIFLANMSHELRTPLNAIIGFSELMIDAKESNYDAATKTRFLTQIHTSGKHLLGLINDILDLSKVEAGQMELRMQPVDGAQVVAQVLSTIEPLAAKKSIKVEAAYAGLGRLTADAAKLRQMLLNLVANAIKFTPEGGTVTVSAAQGPSSVEISVEDTGIGISAEDQAKIFREFHQIDTGPGRREQGTGLGLALTRRFAQLHGGDVTVRSEVGRGSVFTLRLPVQAPKPEVVAAPARPASAAADSSRPLVLVIEDDQGAAELLTRQLEGGGFRTHVARTGTDAIAAARAMHPAAITLDILLPELDGWEVMSRLKADPETSEIPVIVVSVIDNPDLGLALGALDYFVKPVDGGRLVNRLKRMNLKPRTGGGAATVLVVDDEAANRHWLTRILEPAGFTVSLASGGREAIDLAKASPPDLVLLDLMMPEVTGFDVVQALRSDSRTQDTPIMILTARHLTEDDKRQLNGHVSTILSRGSVGGSDLVGLLQQVVENTGTATAG